MFHSVGRIMRWAGAYRKRMVLGFVCSFFATWCTAGPVVLAAWALGQLIVDAWGEERLSPHLPWLCLGGIVVLILLRFFFTYWKNRLQESIGTERAAEQRMELGNVPKPYAPRPISTQCAGRRPHSRPVRGSWGCQTSWRSGKVPRP